MRLRILAIWCVVALIFPLLAAGQALDQDEFEVSHIRGDLYRVRAGVRHSVFLVTTDGIILADPMGVAAATWLREDLARRFPGRPVRFVLLTGHDFERAGGAWVFKPTAEVIAHATFNDELRIARRGLPRRYLGLDENGDGLLDDLELRRPPAEPGLLRFDVDRDGKVSPGELFKDVQDVESTYRDQRTVTLGGRTVLLRHAAIATVPDASLLAFPSEREAFATTLPIELDRRPVTLTRDSAGEVLGWVHEVASLDADVLRSGVGGSYSATDIKEVASYGDELLRAVQSGFERGWSADMIERSAALATYRDRPQFQRARDIREVHGALRLLRVDLFGVAQASRLSHSNVFCEAATACTTGPVSQPGGGILVIVSGGRFGIGVEGKSGTQYIAARTTSDSDLVLATRETVISLMLRFTMTPRRSTAVSWVVGPAFGLARSDGSRTNRIGVSRGPQPTATSVSGMGITAGVDIERRLGSRVSFLVPLRWTGVSRSSYFSPAGRYDVSAGAGVGVRLFRQLTLRSR
jgi:glyoxylase-like metal-dependent hydrolase (beta-lactamase superfamily II)